MRILYGVTGEGLGHAMRSAVVIDALQRRGHRVKVAASGRAEKLLAARFDDVLGIHGLFIVYRDGSMARARTVVENLRAAPGLVRRNVALYEEEIRAFDPDMCVSDFDSFAHLYGKTHGKPVVAIDHQHVLDRCAHPRTVRATLSPGFAAARTFVRAKMPGCDHYVIPTFFFPPPRKRLRDKTTLVAPILRECVTRASPTEGDEVLVYLTSPEHARLIDSLGDLREHRFVVYGAGARPSTANARFMPFAESSFVADLAASRAVIANGGFTTVSEALFLGKPVLSIPVQGQHEQELNAAYLAELGVGARVNEATPRDIARFLDRLDAYRAALARTPRMRGNREVGALADRLFDAVAA